MGHLLGGWAIAPLFTYAQRRSPWVVFNLNGSCQSFGEVNCSTGSTNGNNSLMADGAVLASKYTGGTSANYNLNVSETTVQRRRRELQRRQRRQRHQHVPQPGSGLQATPALRPRLRHQLRQTAATSRHAVLGISMPPFPRTSASGRKDVGATLIFQITNVLNHIQLGDPYLDISDPSNFGVLGTNNPYYGGQVNSPRQMQFGLRIHF